MGQFEPKDSRIITQNPSSTPIEPERTGPREGATREGEEERRAQEAMKDERTEADDDNERWQVTETKRRFEDDSQEGDNQP